MNTAEAPPGGGDRLLGSASLLAAGNVASRLLGLVREQVIAAYWGGTVEASAFAAAARVPTMIYDLIIGGMLSAALVPVLAAYGTGRRDELWRAASVLLSAAAVLTGLLAMAVFALAGPIAGLLAADLPAGGEAIVARCLRFIAPAVLAFGVAGILTGVLYALERFTLPAAAGAVYNALFIAAVLTMRHRLGVYALPLGVTVGGLAQVVLLLPGLRDAVLRPRLDLHHPALARVLVLYLPIGAGLMVSQTQVVIDTRLASRAGEAALSWMRYATALVQFPHGLIAAAVSLAILPRLAASHARVESETYARILARAVRVVLLLSLPAAIGLAAVASPVVGAVFQRGVFFPADRLAVTAALYGYLLGLPFAAVDWPLNYAFYARQNTLVPAVVGVGAVGVYLVVAVLFGPVLNAAHLSTDRVFLGLVVADSAKQAFHAIVMLYLVRRTAGSAALRGVGSTAVRAAVAAILMGGVVVGLDYRLAATLGGGTLAWAVRAALAGGVGVSSYLLLARYLGMEDIDWLINTVRARLPMLAPPAP